MFQASGGFLRINANQNMMQLPTLLAQSVPKFRKNLHAVHAQFIGQLDKKAEANFNSSIIRRGEKGQGKGGTRDRQTGNFDFGGGGSAFQGRLMEEGSLVGFGWPDIKQADIATNYVWRSLEFGLAGKRNQPTSKLSGGAVFPSDWHRLPRSFYFTPGRGPSVDRMVPLKGGGYRQAKSRRRNLYSEQDKKALGTLDMTIGAGIKGKHFLEDAWIELKIGDAKKYKPVVEQSFRVFT